MVGLVSATRRGGNVIQRWPLTVVLMFVLAACGDPTRSVVLTNESDVDVVVGLQPAHDYAPADVVIRPGKTRIAFAGSAAAQDELVSLWTEACEPIGIARWTTDDLQIYIRADLSTLVTEQSTEVGGVIIQDAEDSPVSCSR